MVTADSEAAEATVTTTATATPRAVEQEKVATALANAALAKFADACDDLKRLRESVLIYQLTTCL